ncbi:MMPL family transporter [Sutcliffiella sp. NC1]|uniref:MMPL family transporter n=1 Tax=Sutcliffiella sp. NC1 TaxID=3004096 RepID=UPI0022DE7F7D|nr:MMPL family transporter [Sutcliffiella sp. NC1]WBL15855.1 MMPL family transporter [Sutcliffiella sp. NC1]
MKLFLQAITDRVSTKKGMWITLSLWLIVTAVLTVFAPSVKEYQVSSIDALPSDAKAVIAQSKVDQYFSDSDGVPAILVFESQSGTIELTNLVSAVSAIEDEGIEGLAQVIPLAALPPQAVESFFSEDGTTAIVPVTLDGSLESKEIKAVNEQIYEVVESTTNLNLYITGPAGIAADTLDLFSRADLVLIFSTVGLILVLLIIIYRSPLLALIPLLAAGIVHEVVMKSLGILGSTGVLISQQTVSIMLILLFAAVIDYSLFVFSRFREELKDHEDKFTAMRSAMRETGMPVFFSGGTVLAAMLVLFVAQSGDYRNFAPTFATALVVIILASVTLVPALFALFGRKSFWPKVPKVGEAKVKTNSVWSRVGRFVVRKPGLAVGVVVIFLIISSLNMFNLKYEFDTMKSFPEDMPSRYGYELLEEKFAPGDLAPSTVLLEGTDVLTPEQQEELRVRLSEQSLVDNVRVNGVAEDGKVVSYSVTFAESPYSVESIDAMETMMNEEAALIGNLDGNLYFAGETAKQVDNRDYNNRDTILIVILETILIFLMLIVLTKSVKMPIYMMGTILVSFLAALGIGMFLTELLFGIDTISNRVPLYAFVFLVALGIDYNIMLVSRFQEERKKHSVKKAVEIAVANTGGVISSAGLILAATFAVLMTQPIELLFVFGFIVAVGILIDTFIIRGFLLPGLLVLFEKDDKAVVSEKNN